MDFKVVRDNRWGYGLAGGGGVAVLVKQLEFSVRVRYYFAIRTCCAITTSMREIRRTATKIHSILPPSDPRSIT